MTKHKHVAIRLTHGEYAMLERLRAASGERSLNAMVRYMINEWGKDLDAGNVVVEPPRHIKQILG